MKPETKHIIQSAVVDALSNNWNVRPHITYAPKQQECCPLGAVWRTQHLQDLTSLCDLVEAGKLAGMDILESREFARGFDGIEISSNWSSFESRPEAYALGISFRNGLVHPK